VDFHGFPVATFDYLSVYGASEVGLAEERLVGAAK
jgi:hypothetical protein